MLTADQRIKLYAGKACREKKMLMVLVLSVDIMMRLGKEKKLEA
jgi:hypothetical protein